MKDKVKIGIIICDRYRMCAGGKCLRSLRNREGAFDIYRDRDVELVGYPPCPRIAYFRDFIQARYGVEVVVGTHPIPQKYLNMHNKLGTWGSPAWQELIRPTLADEETRLAYD